MARNGCYRSNHRGLLRRVDDFFAERARRAHNAVTRGSVPVKPTRTFLSRIQPQTTSRWRTLATLVFPIHLQEKDDGTFNAQEAPPTFTSGFGLPRIGRLAGALAGVAAVSAFVAPQVVIVSEARAQTSFDEDAKKCFGSLEKLSEFVASLEAKLGGDYVKRVKQLENKIMNLASRENATVGEVFQAMVEAAFLAKKAGVKEKQIRGALRIGGMPQKRVNEAIKTASKMIAHELVAPLDVNVGNEITMVILRKGEPSKEETITIRFPDGARRDYTTDAEGKTTFSTTSEGTYNVSSSSEILGKINAKPVKTVITAGTQEIIGSGRMEEKKKAKPLKRVNVEALQDRLVEGVKALSNARETLNEKAEKGAKKEVVDNLQEQIDDTITKANDLITDENFGKKIGEVKKLVGEGKDFDKPEKGGRAGEIVRTVNELKVPEKKVEDITVEVPDRVQRGFIVIRFLKDGKPFAAGEKVIVIVPGEENPRNYITEADGSIRPLIISPGKCLVKIGSKIREFVVEKDMVEQPKDKIDLSSLTEVEKKIYEAEGEKGVRVYRLVDGERTNGEIMKEAGIDFVTLEDIIAFMEKQGLIKTERPEDKKVEETKAPPETVAKAEGELSVEVPSEVKVKERIVIRFSRDGKPVANETFALTKVDSGLSGSITTDENGVYSFVTNLPGKYKVIAGDVTQEFTVNPSEEKEEAKVEGVLTVEAPKEVNVGERVTVKVLRDGKPVGAGEKVTLVTPAGMFRFSTKTDENGEFRFDANTDGPYQVKSGEKVLAEIYVISRIEPLPAYIAMPVATLKYEQFLHNTTDPIGLTKFLHDGYRVEASFRLSPEEGGGKKGAFNVFVVYDQERKRIKITDELTGKDLTLTNKTVKRIGPGLGLHIIGLSSEWYARVIWMYENVGSKQLEWDGAVTDKTSHASELQGEFGIEFGEWFAAFLRASNDRDARLLFAARGKIPYSLAQLLSYKAPEGGGTTIEVSGGKTVLENPNDVGVNEKGEVQKVITSLVRSGVEVLVDSSLVKIGEGLGGKPRFMVGLAGGGAYEDRGYGNTSVYRRLVKVGGSVNISDLLSGNLLYVGGVDRQVIRFEGDGRDSSNEKLNGFGGSGALNLKPLFEDAGLPVTDLRAIVSGTKLNNGEEALMLTIEGRF